MATKEQALKIAQRDANRERKTINEQILLACDAIDEAMDKLADSPDDDTDTKIRNEVRGLAMTIAELVNGIVKE